MSNQKLEHFNFYKIHITLIFQGNIYHLKYKDF